MWWLFQCLHSTLIQNIQGKMAGLKPYDFVACEIIDRFIIRMWFTFPYCIDNETLVSFVVIIGNLSLDNIKISNQTESKSWHASNFGPVLRIQFSGGANKKKKLKNFMFINCLIYFHECPCPSYFFWHKSDILIWFAGSLSIFVFMFFFNVFSHFYSIPRTNNQF